MPSDESSEDDAYGPALPPHLQNKSGSKPAVIIGPQLPSSFMKSKSNHIQLTEETNRPNHFNQSDSTDEEDSGEIEIGPYLPDDPRSKLMPLGKVPVAASMVPTKREEWMLVCPQNRPLAEAVGLGPRKFLTKTPDEPKKAMLDDEEEEEDFLETARAELEAKRERERDEEMEAFKSSTGRNESLLSLHIKKRKMDEGKGEGPKERRPFDRDIDLKVNGLSDKDKEKFIKKCGDLSGRFKGGKRKFL